MKARIPLTLFVMTFVANASEIEQSFDPDQTFYEGVVQINWKHAYGIDMYSVVHDGAVIGTTDSNVYNLDVSASPHYVSGCVRIYGGNKPLTDAHCYDYTVEMASTYN